jgi:DNA-directed RNA polymerase specialized sigma24 family protein
LNFLENQAQKNEHNQQHYQRQEQEQQSVQWRRDKVLELTSQDHSQRDISTILQVSLGTVNKDLTYLKQQSRQKIRK